MSVVRPRTQRRTRWLFPLLSAAVLAAGLVVAAPVGDDEAAAQDEPVKILLAGDSITAGEVPATDCDPGTSHCKIGQWPTFRGPLWWKLTGSGSNALGPLLGRDVDFVGSFRGIGSPDPGPVCSPSGAGPAHCRYELRIDPLEPSDAVPFPLVDPDHEGHIGWTIDQLKDVVIASVDDFEPDVLILFSGANDIAKHVMTDTPRLAGEKAAISMIRAVQAIRAARPGMRIVVPTLPPHELTQKRTNAIIHFNENIEAQLGALPSAIVPDVFSSYCAKTQRVDNWNTNKAGGCAGVEYNNDGSHPNQMGGEFIARQLGDAMEAAGFLDGPVTGGPVSGDGYFVLEQDGDVFGFGDARDLLKAMDPSATDDNTRGATISSALKGQLAGQLAVAIELTFDRTGLWVLRADGAIVTLGNAPPMNGVGPGVMTKTVAGQPERPAAMALLGTGDLWVFTSAGRIVPQSGALPSGANDAMQQVLAADLVGPILDAKPTVDGGGAYATGDDGGVFAYAAPFRGSVPEALADIGRTRPDQPVVGLTVDPDGDGYWLVAADGGVFAFAAPFVGSLPAVVPFDQLQASIGGMVPFGNGYLLVGKDGGVFNFSNKPFSGSASGLVDTQAVAIASL